MNRILIIQTAFLGDVILATPLIERLHKENPNVRIDFLLRNGNQGLLESHPLLNQVLIWDKKKGKYKALFRLIKQIRTTRYDLVVNVQRFAASGIITALSRAKSTVGFEKNPFASFFTKKVAHHLGSIGDKSFLHEVDRNLMLLGKSSAFYRPKLYPTPHDFDTVTNLQSKPFITISPASVWFTKQFPPDQWVKLINELNHYRVFLLGSPADVVIGEYIREACDHEDVEVLAGKLSLLQSAALMSGAKMNYVNDSAPMHMASAMNAPTTAVYCSTVPEFGFGPMSDRSSVVQSREKLECRPCGLHGKAQCPLGHFNCASNITTSALLKPLD